jgi:uncharacterized tellurite resistance protein B-like protein
MGDRILEIVDLLLGAAHADRQFRAEEEASVRRLLADVLGVAEVPLDVEARIAVFTVEGFDLAATAAAFADDSEAEKRKLLELVAAVRDSDEEIDLDEDAYLRSLAQALGLPAAAFADLTLDVQVEELRESVATLRKKPPPIPKA